MKKRKSSQKNLVNKYYSKKKNLSTHKKTNTKPLSIIYTRLQKALNLNKITIDIKKENKLNSVNKKKHTEKKIINSLKLLKLKNFHNFKTKKKNDSISLITNNPTFHKNVYLLANPEKFKNLIPKEKFNFEKKNRRKSSSFDESQLRNIEKKFFKELDYKKKSFFITKEMSCLKNNIDYLKFGHKKKEFGNLKGKFLGDENLKLRNIKRIIRNSLKV